jgi:hypothetical protein
MDNIKLSKNISRNLKKMKRNAKTFINTHRLAEESFVSTVKDTEPFQIRRKRFTYDVDDESIQNLKQTSK